MARTKKTDADKLREQLRQAQAKLWEHGTSSSENWTRPKVGSESSVELSDTRFTTPADGKVNMDQVWLVRFSDGGDYEGIRTIHRTLEGAEKARIEAAKEDEYLSYFVTGPREVID